MDSFLGVSGRLAAVVVAKRATAGNRTRTIFAERRVSELRRAVFGNPTPLDAPHGAPIPASRALNETDAVSGVAGRIAAVVIAQVASDGGRPRTMFAMCRVSEMSRDISGKTRPMDSPTGSPTPASRVLNANGAVSGVAGRFAAVAIA